MRSGYTAPCTLNFGNVCKEPSAPTEHDTGCISTSVLTLWSREILLIAARNRTVSHRSSSQYFSHYTDWAIQAKVCSDYTFENHL